MEMIEVLGGLMNFRRRSEDAYLVSSSRAIAAMTLVWPSLARAITTA